MQLTLYNPPLVFVRVAGPRGTRELSALVSPSSRYCLIGRRDITSLGYSTGPYHRKVAFLPEVDRGHALALITVGGIIEAPIVTIKQIEIGDVMASDVQTVVYDLPEPTGFDMLIGHTFFSGLRLEMDYRSALLTITS